MGAFYKPVFLAGFLLFILSNILGQDSLQVKSLEYYLEKGIQNNPLLKDNINTVDMNRIDSLINIAINKPFVQTTGVYLYAPVHNRWGYAFDISNGGQYTGLMQVSRNLFYRKNLKIENRLNSALKDSILNTFRINKNDLDKAITDLYLISYQDYRQMEIFNDLFNILSDQNKILKELLKSAFFTQADYLAFRVDLQQSEINWQTAKIQYLQDILSLNILCNINDTTLVRLAEPHLIQKAVFHYDNNPYLHRYKFDSIIVERNRRMIDIFYRPKLNLTIDGGLNTNFANLIPRNFGYSVLLDFSLPIYNGNQRRYQYHKLDISQRTIRNYKFQYITRLTLKLKTINEQLKVNQNLLEITEKQNEDIENLLKISQDRLYTGDMSAIDYLIIFQKYLNIKVNLNLLRIQRQQLISEFNYRAW